MPAPRPDSLCPTCKNARRVVYDVRTGKMIGPANRKDGSRTPHREIVPCRDCEDQ